MNVQPVWEQVSWNVRVEVTGTFDFGEVFDDDYLYFYKSLLTEERSDTESELIWHLGRVAVGEEILDLACGHGRLEILRRVYRSFRRNGRFLIELIHAPGLWANFLPSVVQRQGEDMMIDEHHYDAIGGRVHNNRTIIRDGRVRSFSFAIRLFAYPELRDWLFDAGLPAVDGFVSDGSPLTHQSRRMIARAVR